AGNLEKVEDPMLAAMRELSEETGFQAERLSLLTVLYPSPGYTNEKIYLYAAHGVTRGKCHLDEDEFLDLEMIPMEEAVKMVQNGDLRDAKSIAALMLYRSLSV
ncbi:MAG: NUDIX hydrolase, partial [Clostridia bacterium]|nr:NUDIX hydrolase [Clostridia bacterium]